METVKKYDDLVNENEILKAKLKEAEDAIEAIRAGEVDAFIVQNNNVNEIYTLNSADKTYRIFIEKMSEGAVTLNKDGLILYSNSSFAKMLGIRLDDVIGIPFQDLVPHSTKLLVEKLIKDSWEEECKSEIILTGKNNKEIPVLLSLNILEIEGRFALSIIITDLSFQKEMQEQKRVLEQKDEFISIASHELKTPVTSIKGYVQLLRFYFEKEGNIKAADLLNKADLQINKLTTLISDLLDIKKIENGQLQYHEEYFDFNELVKETIEETQRVLSRNNIILNLNETQVIYGDRNKVGQVITNLIDNAAKYSPSNKDININTFIKDNKVGLSIEDRGIGIPKEQQAKIFERFFRVNHEKENTYSGLGLGLYISSEIIKRHNGKIGVESEKGKGSTFYFELPVFIQEQ